MDQKFPLNINIYFTGNENIRWFLWEREKNSFMMFKIKSFWKKNQLFPTCVLLFLACPPLGGNFYRDNPNRTWTFCPLMRGVRYFCPLFRSFFYKGFVLILSGLLTFETFKLYIWISILSEFLKFDFRVLKFEFCFLCSFMFHSSDFLISDFNLMTTWVKSTCVVCMFVMLLKWSSSIKISTSCPYCPCKTNEAF